MKITLILLALLISSSSFAKGSQGFYCSNGGFMGYNELGDMELVAFANKSGSKINIKYIRPKDSYNEEGWSAVNIKNRKTKAVGAWQKDYTVYPLDTKYFLALSSDFMSKDEFDAFVVSAEDRSTRSELKCKQQWCTCYLYGCPFGN